MTKITFLGTGNAFVPPVMLPNGSVSCAWQSNLLLETNDGMRLLLDCGTDIRFSLAEQGLTPADIDGVYISHIHADHFGGMEYLAYSTFFNPEKEKPALYCVKDILFDLENALQPDWSPIINRGSVGIEDFFEIICLEGSESSVQISEFLAIMPVQVVHVPGEDVRKLSYGLMFIPPELGNPVFWTSDTVFEPDKYAEHYVRAGIILQDCELGFKTGVHAHLDDLRTLPDEIKRKMWLYHHNPALIAEAGVPEGEFAGFAHKGQVIEF